MVVGSAARHESLTPDRHTDLDDDQLDLVFRALCDRTRRDIVRRSMEGTLSVSALARHYPMSTTAVQKHVGVLEEAGLVSRSRRGREQLVRTEVDTIERARRALGEFEELWRTRLGQIDQLVGIDRAGDVLDHEELGEHEE